MQRFFLDARKLGDGGIGTFIETLIEGSIDYNRRYARLITLDIVVSKSYLKEFGLPKSWENSKNLHFYTDDTKKYSISEYLVFPIRWNHIIKNCALYIAPHYTLPLGIKTKKLVLVHDVIQVEYPEKITHHLFPKKLIKSAVKRADVIATVSEHSKERISRVCKFPEDKIKIIPNAIRPNFLDVTKIDQRQAVPNFLFVSSDRLHKQLDVFIEFLSLLKKAHVSFKAQIVSKLSDASLAALKNYNVTEHVKIHSDISNAELAALYKSVTAYVCTSIEEGFCIPILDAMSAQVPVFCPDLPFSRELTQGNAIFYRCGSSADLFYQFSKYSEESKLREKIVGNARAVSEKFTPLHQFESLLACA